MNYLHKKKHDSFDNIRPNIYNQRVDNYIAKQFKQCHNNEYITVKISDAQGLRKRMHAELIIYMAAICLLRVLILRMMFMMR